MVKRNGTMRLLIRAGYVVLLTAFVLGAAETILATTDSRSEVNRAVDWVEEHRASLPNTLNAIAAYPEWYRRTINTALDPGTRSRLWREQLDLFLEATETLSSEQRQYVLNLRAKLTPEYFATETAEDGKSMCADILRLFPDRQQRQPLGVLGAVVSADHSVSSMVVAARERLVRLGFGNLAFADSSLFLCNCDPDYEDCQCFSTEDCTGNPCSTHAGCGCGPTPTNCVGECVVDP